MTAAAPPQPRELPWRARLLVLLGVGCLASSLLSRTPVARADDAPDEPASPVTIEGRTEPDTVTIGTHFRYTIEVTAPVGLEIVLSQPTEKIGDFDILDYGDAPEVERDGRHIITRWYTLVGWETGYKILESPTVLFRQGDAEHELAPADETVVTVESLLKDTDTTADLRALKDIESVPINWRPYWLAGSILLALIAVGAGLFWALNRRQHATIALPVKPPHETAYAALARLRRLDLIQHGAFKEYYSGLSGIIRTYVEQRFGVRAPEMTTEEFLVRSARKGDLQGQHRGLLASFLGESDLVKFARHLPTIDDSERAYEAAKRFVDETTQVQEGGIDAPR